MRLDSRVTTVLLSCLLPLLIAFSPAGAVARTVLVPTGSTWKYLDDGSDQGTAWSQTGFDDAAWQSGPAQLGYGDGDEATVVGFGPDPNHKYVTTYFRHAFSVTDPSTFGSLLIRLLRDDGAIVYLNGVEACRSNMPAGTVDYLTLASSAVSGSGEYTFYDYTISPSLLAPGPNVLAVEIHQSSVTSSDVSFDLELLADSYFRKEPYLTFDGNPDGMTVRWQLLDTRQCSISWGLDSLYSQGSAITNQYGTDHQHSFNISALAPAALHYYRVVTGRDTATGWFRSAPSAGADSLKFFAYGDSRTYPLDHDQVASAMVSAAQADPDLLTLVVSVGDLVTNGDVEADWDAELFDADYPGIVSMLARLPFQVAMGNHEASGALFVKYFPYPFAGGRYWSFDYGPAHFVVLDQYTAYGPGSAQLAWLANDLAATDRPWRFICMHEPGWSAGGGHENDPVVQDYIQPLCEQYGVAAVFAGHNHYYARCEVNGVQHITTGGGGAPLYAPDTTYPNVVAAAMALHYCTIQIDRNVLEFRALTPAGQVIDQFSFVRTPIGVLEPGHADDLGANREAGPALSVTYPNPFTSSVRFSFFLADSSRVLLRVFGVDGRLVRTLAAEYLEPGEHQVRWDGLDDGGREVASGVYIARLEAAGHSSAVRVLVLR